MTTTENQRDTGQDVLPRYGGHSVGTLANALFITALAVIEASLLFSYYMVQHEAPQWPPPGYGAPSLAGVSIATAVLLVSIVPLILAYRSVRRDRVERLFLSLSAMFTLGLTFFLIQTVSYIQLDLQPVETVYSALIIALGTFHLVITLIALTMAGLVIYRTVIKTFHSGHYLAIETLLFTWGFVLVSGVLTAGTIYLNPHL